MSRSTRPGFGEGPGVLFAALTVALGLQTMRAFFPLVVYVYGTRPGVSSVGMGVVAIGVFLAAWLAALPARVLGPTRALGFSAALLALTRLVAQFAGPDEALWISAAGTVAFLWAFPSLLAAARSGGGGGTARLAVGLLLGLALDTAISGAFWTLDPIWQRTVWAAVTAFVLVLGYARLFRDLNSAAPGRERTDAPLGSALALIGLGPILLLHMLLLQNVARLTAVTGWPMPAALLMILAIDAIGIAAAAIVRSPRAGLLAALVLIPAACLAHGTGLEPPGALLAAGALAVAGLAAAVLVAAILAAQGRGPLGGGLGRTAAGWGLGMTLFVIPAFLYYVGYDISLPFASALLPPVLAVLAAVAALGPIRVLRQAPVLRRGRGRAALALLLVPLVAWVFLRPPTPEPGTGWPIRVMSYNLHQGFGISGSQDLEAIARTIEEAGADLVALQEVSRGWVINGSTDMLVWLGRRLRMPYVWGPAADAVWGNAILSRRPIAAWGNQELPRGGAPMRRAAMWADVDLGGGEQLLVIATHFHHVKGHGHIREPQAAAVVRLWNGRERAVLLGDLNAHPDAREMAMLREAGLRDAFVLAGQGDGFTYRSDRPYERIDYVWVSQDLGAREFRVMPGQASDHLGIAVTISR